MTKKVESYEYQAEIKKVLDVVIHSLYTNKDIFIRELISNAADALEKFRHVSLTEKDIIEKDLPLNIKIELNKKAKTFTISDTGIGMTKDELIENLGTVAHSGSKEFLEKLAENKENAAKLIGQFGLGFYSAFMVSQKVRVISRSYKKNSKGYIWTSDGISNYTISQEEGIKRGTRIVVDLKKEYEKYAEEDNVKNIIKEYSNFVSSPIFIDEKRINTVQAIWVKNPNEVKDKEYNEFYKFLTNSPSEPFYHLHTSSDAPIQMKTILFFPKENMEIFGFNRMEPGINLYCNKILIESKVKEILPDYLRFVKGVVDSEDLPLNISRETLQDNLIISKIKKFLTKRVISFLNDNAQKDEKKHLDFWKTFSPFIKEGINSDFENREKLAKLLRFETSKTKENELTSFDEYLKRAKKDQKEIYFLSGKNRQEIENSPYLETFIASDIEVIYLYEAIDDFTMSALSNYDKKELSSADKSDIKVPKKESEKKESKKSIENFEKLTKWMEKLFKKDLEKVVLSDRLVNSPAIIVNPDDKMTTNMQKILKDAKGDFFPAGKKILEINPEHALIKKISKLVDSKKDKKLITQIAEQIYDNALFNAGMDLDKSKMVKRMNDILEQALKSK
ncbi:MAG: molecular chaperone HtpG [Candidatus Marinimicrobia bacterium]|jgi:TNF receptor-associated protein 1|nr:molecular chaperone HtpG [Candidatus Neomarinimicrobiota bacterium]